MAATLLQWLGITTYYSISLSSSSDGRRILSLSVTNLTSVLSFVSREQAVPYQPAYYYQVLVQVSPWVLGVVRGRSGGQ